MVDEAAKKARAEYLKKYLSKDDKSVTKKHKKKRTDNSRTGLKIHEDDAFAVVAPCANHVTSDDESEKDVVIIQNAKSKEAPKFKRAAFESVDIKTEVSAIRKRHDTPSDEELHDVPSLPGSSVQLKQRNPDSSYPDRHIITKKNGQNSSQDSDASPPRRQIKDEPIDSDPSPPRRSAINAKLSSAGNTDNGSDNSLPRFRKRTGDSHSDTSPPRRRIDDFKDGSRVEKSAHYSRWKRRRSGNDDSPRRTYDHDSDASPPRIRDAKKTKREHHRIIKEGSATSNYRDREDYRQRRVSTTSEAVSRYGKNDQSNEGHKRPGLKTLEEHREEMKKLEENEGKMLKDWDDYIDGKNAAAVRRIKMTGKGRQTKEDREKKEREAKKQQELEEKYEKWNKGLKQIKERADKLNEMARVVQEDFARHVDNKAMNEHMKEQLYEKDPMFNYVKRKKDKTEIKSGTAYPKYKGSWPPNRYNIAPGYRWDGVNRSNGFEDKIAEVANRKAAQLTEYYENIAKYEV